MPSTFSPRLKRSINLDGSSNLKPGPVSLTLISIYVLDDKMLVCTVLSTGEYLIALSIMLYNAF